MPRPRYGRYYSGSGDQHQDRVRRAFEQPLQLLQCKYFIKSKRWEIRVSTSTGVGYYELTFDPEGGSCSCPDFGRRGKPCKHMLCVLLRILKLKDTDFTSIEQVGESYDQITPTFLKLFHHEATSLPSTNEEGEEAKETVSEDEEHKKSETVNVKEEKPKPEETPTEEEMCLICLLEFIPNEGTMSKCTSHCKRWLGHQECLNTWFQKSRCCPLCKGPQQTLMSTVVEPAYKRARYYGYSSYSEEVDISTLQAQTNEGEAVAENVFFEIIHE